MTTEQFINLAKTCNNRTELLQKMGNYENTIDNIKTYIVPMRKQAKLTPKDLSDLFIKPINTKPTNTTVNKKIEPKKEINTVVDVQNKPSLKITRS